MLDPNQQNESVHRVFFAVSLAQAQREICTRRTRSAELLSKIRDPEHDLPEGSLQRIVTENTRDCCTDR
ncbi:hypothetical protein ACIF9R_32815 [Streptomyces sp. NPDC086080]|uniref:hypothetical protein n=1 Tax=Streptomyces sp. NPDC086080 TaxID=3365748 RepID=UPI0037D6DF76